MDDYSYSNGRGRLGFRFWGTAKDGAETRDGWSNSAFLNRAEVNQDHVCRPVIIGSDGKAMPGVIDCPNHNKDGTVTNGFPNKGGNYQSGSHHGGDKPRAQEFINNVQNAASDGGRTGFPAGIFQRQKFDYGGYETGANDMSNNRWNKPVHGRYESFVDNLSTEPSLITRGGRARLSLTARTQPSFPPAAPMLPSGAMAGGGRRNSALRNTYQPKKRDSATTTIDSREAAKRYGGMSV